MVSCHDLPDDVLRNIFELLHPSDFINCTAVCARWRRLIIMYMTEEMEVVRDLGGRELRLDTRRHQWRICVSPMIHMETRLWKWAHAFVRKSEERFPFCTRSNQDVIHRRNESREITAPKYNTRDWPDLPLLKPVNRFHIPPVLKTILRVEVFTTKSHLLDNIDNKKGVRKIKNRSHVRAQRSTDKNNAVIL